MQKSSRTRRESFLGRHRFEHWYVDNQIYFITARCRDRYPAFKSENAKAVFWDRFEHYAAQAGFTPWVTSLMDNHYHTLGYIREGKQLIQMMQRLHGSTAKLVNDVLPERRPEFWGDRKGKEYFDGCIRNERQCRLAFRYTLMQSVQHGICSDHRDYRETRVIIELERGIQRAHELGAFMDGVPYKRYER